MISMMMNLVGCFIRSCVNFIIAGPDPAEVTSEDLAQDSEKTWNVLRLTLGVQEQNPIGDMF